MGPAQLHPALPRAPPHSSCLAAPCAPPRRARGPAALCTPPHRAPLCTPSPCRAARPAAHTWTCTRTCTHAHAHETHMHTRMHTHMHTYTHLHTYTHTRKERERERDLAQCYSETRWLPEVKTLGHQKKTENCKCTRRQPDCERVKCIFGPKTQNEQQ